MRMMLILLTLLTLGSCATLSEEECALGDWRGIGFEDGAAGRAPDFIAQHREACAEVGVSPNLSLWLAGREQGLRTYCTAQNAYSITRRGSSVRPYCTAVEQAAMAPAIRRGDAYRRVARELEQAREDLAEIEAEQTAAIASGSGAITRTVTFAQMRVTRLEMELQPLSRWP